MDRTNIAAQLYTLRNYLKTPDDIYSSLKQVHDIGYPAIQVSGLGPIEPQRLKAMADEFGLKICVTHTPYDDLVNDIDSVISWHRLWDCDNVGLGSMPSKFRSGKEGYLAFIRVASGIAEKLAMAGLHFVYHNHRFEFEKYDGITGLDLLLEETLPDMFGFELDTYWVQAGGANPVDWIRKVRGRMAVVHLKDMAIKDDKQVFAEIGRGNLDWPSIIQACRETSVKWYAVEQDICAGDPFDCLKTSFQYLETLA